MKNILIINGHHKKESFSSALVDAYKNGALKSNAEVRQINMSETNFQFIESNFENDKLTTQIKKAQESILWADHIVWVYPIWWYGTPSKLQSFIENVFVGGFAFEYHKNKKSKYVTWDKLLKGKTTRIISTMDAPPWYFKLIFKDPNYKRMKATLNFCGINAIKTLYFGSVKGSDVKTREKWLLKTGNLGTQLK